MPNHIDRATALTQLRDAGAHLVHCRESKQPYATNWQNTPFTDDILPALQRGDVFGIKPSSLGLLCMDYDGGSERDYGPYVAKLPSRSAGRFHIWYAYAGNLRKRKWQDGDAYGDLICNGGQVILWHDAPQQLATQLARRPWPQIDAAALPPKPQRDRTAERVLREALAELDAAPEGERNDTLFATAAKLYGFTKANRLDESTVTAKLEAHAAARGLTDTETRATLQSALEAATPQEKGAAASDALQWTDVDDPALYYDIRRDAYVWRDKPLDNERRWGSFLNTLSERHGKTTTLRRLQNELIPRIGEGLERDPFIDYLESLPTWDRTERLPSVLERLGADTDDALTQWAGCAIFGVAVARAYRPGYAVKETVILQGPQEIGKTPFLRFMVPTEREFDWFGNVGAMNDFDSRRLLEAVQGRVVCELEECEGLNDPRSLERVKRFLSATNDGGMRMSHRRDPEARPRRAVIVGTTNQTTPLPADTGSSRFVVIPCTPSPDHDTDTLLAELAADREQLWAEARHRWFAKETFRLPRELRGIRDTANQRFMETDDEIVTALENTPPGGWTRTTAIAHQNDLGSGPWVMRRIRQTAEQIGLKVRKLDTQHPWEIELPKRQDAAPLPF